ncbi:Uncharacterised protein [Streptococcus suis]|uniref:Uncharacterized protein n=1 Tax=Streptococcus suis TaxID=1307 RepID=A0A116KW27_STRSU|nr:Uncharacterised protein [Streptococcus suis]
MRTSGSWFSLYSKVRGTVIFIKRLEIGIVGRRFSLYVGRPRRLEIVTAGRQFSLYSKVRGTVIFIKRLEIGIVGRRFSLYVGRPRRLEIGTALGGFLCIQLFKDDSWLELEKWGYFSLSSKMVRWKNLRSFRWLIVECLIDEV